jgi:phospholipid-binding lipoprotein MlaA
MIKFFKLFLAIILLSTNAFAASDGDLKLTKKNKANQTTKDCFEPLNRATFSLNQGLDKLISPIRTGTGNVLNNLSNLITIPNNVLQGELGKAGINTGRLLVNSTIGILGIFDVAQSLGFPEYEREDYGQTLGRWGVGPGCYLVLPVIGPTTVRDTAGSFINVMGGDPYYNASVNGNNEFLSEKVYMTSKILTGINFRAKNIESLENLEKNSMDFYASVRSLYLQDRQRKISNSTGVVETMDDSDWEEIDTK